MFTMPIAEGAEIVGDDEGPHTDGDDDDDDDDIVGDDEGFAGKITNDDDDEDDEDPKETPKPEAKTMRKMTKQKMMKVKPKPKAKAEVMKPRPKDEYDEGLKGIPGMIVYKGFPGPAMQIVCNDCGHTGTLEGDEFRDDLGIECQNCYSIDTHWD
jgi:hypothetical protein